MGVDPVAETEIYLSIVTRGTVSNDGSDDLLDSNNVITKANGGTNERWSGME